MTNKLYYQLAADEVGQGKIDQALWIKVVADMPTATKIQQQAKYIQLRAGELSVESATTKVAGTLPIVKRVLKWVVGLVVVGFVATYLFAMSIDRKDDQEFQRIAIGYEKTVANHLSRHEPDTKNYEDVVVLMDNRCSWWQRTKDDNGWVKDSNDVRAPAIKACEIVSAERMRLLNLPTLDTP